MTYSLWRNGFRLADITEPQNGSGPPSMICGDVRLARDFAEYESITQCPALDRPGAPIVHGITHRLVHSNDQVETTEIRPDGSSVTTVTGSLTEQPLVMHDPAPEELFELRDDAGAVVPIDLLSLTLWPFPDMVPRPDGDRSKRWVVMIALAGSIPESEFRR